MKKLILILAILGLFTGYGSATNYYVDFNATDNTGTGAIGDPWKYAPGMDGCDSNCASEPSNTDTIYLDNADTWTDGSGDAVLAITLELTYDGSTWGAGTRATLESTGALAYGTVNIQTDNITFKGFEVDGGQNNHDGIGINYPGEGFNISNITVEDVIVHDVGDAGNYNYGIIIGSVNEYTTSDVTIIDSVVYDTAHEGICLYPSSASGNQIANITLINNEVYNTGTENEDFGNGILIKNYVNGATIEFNYLHNNPIAIQFEGHACCSQSTDVDIRYNLIKDNDSYGIIIPATGGSNRDVDIFGNLFVDNGNAGAGGAGPMLIYGAQYSSVYKIYNNTMYSIDNQGGTPYGFTVSAVTGTPTIEFKNNIVYTDDHAPVTDFVGSLLTHSNNLLYRTSGSGDTVINDGSTYDRTEVTNWEATAQSTDPTFAAGTLPTGFQGTYGTDMIPNQTYFSIASSDAIDGGADLGGSPLFGAINFSGTSDGYDRDDEGGSAWDIGAYEYSTGSNNNGGVSIN